MCVKRPLGLRVFLRRRPPVALRWTFKFSGHFSKSGSKAVPLGASGAKWLTQHNEHLVVLNTSADVLVKIVEKVREHFTHTGCGPGPGL